MNKYLAKAIKAAEIKSKEEEIYNLFIMLPFPQNILEEMRYCYNMGYTDYWFDKPEVLDAPYSIEGFYVALNRLSSRRHNKAILYDRYQQRLSIDEIAIKHKILPSEVERELSNIKRNIFSCGLKSYLIYGVKGLGNHFIKSVWAYREENGVLQEIKLDLYQNPEYEDIYCIVCDDKRYKSGNHKYKSAIDDRLDKGVTARHTYQYQSKPDIQLAYLRFNKYLEYKAKEAELAAEKVATLNNLASIEAAA